MRKKAFKAESKRLLDLMINSIYTHKEIFLREIISNASDAIDKLCYRSLTDDKVGLTRDQFEIRLSVDAENRLLTVSDTLDVVISDTVGFIRKLPTELIESFKSTLDEVREADLLLHVVDISHPQFEDQIAVVKQTLQDIGAGDKPVYLVFNKVDAYTYVEKEPDDLTPSTRENRSLEDLKQSWIARANTPCIFISAVEKINIEKLRSDLYGMVREIHSGRYPFNNFLY